jgi:hypothetical protein
MATTREWGLLLKVATDPDRAAPSPVQLDRLLASLPGADKRLTGGGRDFTVAWWVEAGDAAAATITGAAALRALAGELGIPDFQVIRSHAASVEGRFPDDPEPGPDVDPDRAWSVTLKAQAPSGTPAAASELADRVRAAMRRADVMVTLRGDPEKFLLDDGSGLTVRFWEEGESPAAVIGRARRRVLDALAAVGLSDWWLVRVKAWAPLQKQGDTFPGAGSRTPSATTEELR